VNDVPDEVLLVMDDTITNDHAYLVGSVSTTGAAVGTLSFELPSVEPPSPTPEREPDEPDEGR
jgi:hypothetical protein